MSAMAVPFDRACSTKRTNSARRVTSHRLCIRPLRLRLRLDGLKIATRGNTEVKLLANGKAVEAGAK
jgi:hypothetical protein